MRFASLCFPILAALSLQCGQAQPVAGGYAQVDGKGPVADQARKMVQRYFSDARLRIVEVQEAYTQVVAGTNIKLVCRVLAAGEEDSVWEFVIWHKLDDSWRLTSAVRVSPLI